MATELLLNRDLPMAGPVQGSTTTKLFGLGFRPAKGVVNAKWGVFSTVEILREIVQTCSWHSESDSSPDTCDELLKTEIFEDNRFP